MSSVLAGSTRIISISYQGNLKNNQRIARKSHINVVSIYQGGSEENYKKGYRRSIDDNQIIIRSNNINRILRMITG